MLRMHRHFIVLPIIFAVVALAACRSPLSPPAGYSEIPHVRISVIQDPNASVDDVKLFRSERRILVVGRVHNETMRAFAGGRVEAQFLNAAGAISAEGSGKIESSLVSSHGSALFRIVLEYGGQFDLCRIIVHPDIEGR